MKKKSIHFKKYEGVINFIIIVWWSTGEQEAKQERQEVLFVGLSARELLAYYAL